MIWHIVKRELYAHFHSLTFWLVLAASQFIIAWLLFAQLEVYARISAQLISAQSNLGVNDLVVVPTLNSLAILLLFVVPLLGMSSFSSERQSGRLAVFHSTNLSAGKLLLGKWLGTCIAGICIAAISLFVIASLSLGMQLDIYRLLSSLITLMLFIAMISAIIVMFSSFTQQASSALAASYLVLLFLWLLDTLAPNDGHSHWLALNPHLQIGFNGLLHSGHLLYFCLLSAAAMGISRAKLLTDIDTKENKLWRFGLFIPLVLICTFLLGQLSTTTAKYIQLSDHAQIPLALQQSLGALSGPISITAYAPDHPLLRARITKLISPLKVHYSAITLHFIDPQKQPHLAAGQNISQEGELVIEGMQQRQQVRQLNNLALTQAFAKLARQGEPWIVALRGHGEANIHSKEVDGMHAFVQALKQQGYKTLDIDPLSHSDIPHNAAVVIIAAPTQAYPIAVQQQIQRYLKQGGHLLWLHEGNKNSSLDKLFGIQTLPGKVVDAAAQKAGLLSPNQIPLNNFPAQLFSHPPSQYVVLNNSVGLQKTNNDWQLISDLQSSPNSWNETSHIQGKLKRNPMLGEQAGPLKLALALQNKQAKAFIIGDSDFIRNSQFGQYGNRAFALSLIHWLTENSALPTAQAADDIQISWSANTAVIITSINLIALPLVFLLIGFWIRRRRLAA